MARHVSGDLFSVSQQLFKCMSRASHIEARVALTAGIVGKGRARRAV